MSLLSPYSSDEPARAEVDALPGATVLEFGANWLLRPVHCVQSPADIAGATLLFV